VGGAVAGVLQSSLAVLNLISLIFVTPIVTFYLLRDWDRMVAAVTSVVPPRLEHGAIIGLLTGLFSFIPYVGMLIGVAVGLTVAVFQFKAALPVALVAAVFFLGQFIEGNFLTPRVVGRRIRLHPVWVIFAVLAGTALFGFVGTFLGTPVAAVIAVLVRFGVEQWRASRYFADMA
jgi:predicted PurR-regulated permease PerM